MPEDRYWCDERMCECFVEKDHRCEQWSNTIRIPGGVVEAIEKEQRDLFRNVLRECLETMQERRGYAEMWEYKYGERWDAEEKMLKEAIGEEGA